jgi:hypothetical protein
MSRRFCAAPEPKGPGSIGYECSEPFGHKGDHVARGVSGAEYARWSH